MACLGLMNVKQTQQRWPGNGPLPTGGVMGRCASAGGLLLALLLFGLENAWAQKPEIPTPEELKARFVMSFAVYTTWPPNALAGSPHFVLGVLGSDPCINVLRASTNLVHGRKLEIRELTGPEGSEQCHMVFITARKLSALPQVLAQIKESSVLSVVDSAQEMRSEGVINLGIEKRQGKPWFCFEINKTAADQAKLKLNSNLQGKARKIF